MSAAPGSVSHNPCEFLVFPVHRLVNHDPISHSLFSARTRPSILLPEKERGEGRKTSRGMPTLASALRPNVASLGYGLFLAINAASVWGGSFPFLPIDFQTSEVLFWFFLAQSLAFSLDRKSVV